MYVLVNTYPVTAIQVDRVENKRKTSSGVSLKYAQLNCDGPRASDKTNGKSKLVSVTLVICLVSFSVCIGIAVGVHRKELS